MEKRAALKHPNNADEWNVQFSPAVRWGNEETFQLVHVFNLLCVKNAIHCKYKRLNGPVRPFVWIFQMFFLLKEKNRVHSLPTNTSARHSIFKCSMNEWSLCFLIPFAIAAYGASKWIWFIIELVKRRARACIQLINALEKKGRNELAPLIVHVSATGGKATNYAN